MNIIRPPHLAAHGNQAFCCCDKPSVGASLQNSIQLDGSPESLQTVIMPLSSIGGKAVLNRALAILKKIKGVKGASPYFQQTALRVYYNPDHTNLYTIHTALQTIVQGLYDQKIH